MGTKWFFWRVDSRVLVKSIGNLMCPNSPNRLCFGLFTVLYIGFADGLPNVPIYLTW